MSDQELSISDVVAMIGPKAKFNDRQDYLAALLHLIDTKLSNDDYDRLTDDAVKWHHAAVKAHESQSEIPDFMEPEEQPPESPPKRTQRPPEPVGTKKRPDYSKITGEKDRYGITIGTKTAEAIKMYEEGCSAKQILDELGGRHYNILKKLQKEGHRISKTELGVWTLTHKDDLQPKEK